MKYTLNNDYLIEAVKDEAEITADNLLCEDFIEAVNLSIKYRLLQLEEKLIMNMEKTVKEEARKY